jgi:hypothetical protein
MRPYQPKKILNDMPEKNEAAETAKIADLQKQVAELEARNKELQQAAADGVPADIASDVGWRMEAGLTRAQAIEAAKAQRAWDEELAAQAKAKEAKEKKGAAKN